MEYRRTNAHPILPTSPSHTHTYINRDSIPLDSWSISIDSTTPLGCLCVHRPCQGYTHNPTGLSVRSQGCTYNPTGPQPFSPIPGSMFDLYYISYKRQHGSSCVLARCGVQSCGIFVALWPTCVVLYRYISSPVA